MKTILKATSKGQITLPATWRKQCDTDQFLAQIKGNKIVISPIDLDELDTDNAYTVFDAIRDNKGKGINASDFVAALEESLS